MSENTTKNVLVECVGGRWDGDYWIVPPHEGPELDGTLAGYRLSEDRAQAVWRGNAGTIERRERL